jgi:hypothetical protein
VLQRLFASVSKINGANHNDYAFLGFHDRFVEGEFLTIFGKISSSFLLWSLLGIKSVQQQDIPTNTFIRINHDKGG